MLFLPVTSGWMVSWYTGKVITRYKGTPREKNVRIKKYYESRSKAEVEAKAKEMQEQGFEIAEICECIF